MTLLFQELCGERGPLFPNDWGLYLWRECRGSDPAQLLVVKLNMFIYSIGDTWHLMCCKYFIMVYSRPHLLLFQFYFLAPFLSLFSTPDPPNVVAVHTIFQLLSILFIHLLFISFIHLLYMSLILLIYCTWHPSIYCTYRLSICYIHNSFITFINLLHIFIYCTYNLLFYCIFHLSIYCIYHSFTVYIIHSLYRPFIHTIHLPSIPSTWTQCYFTLICTWGSEIWVTQWSLSIPFLSIPQWLPDNAEFKLGPSGTGVFF